MTEEIFNDWIGRVDAKLDKITEDLSAIRERTARLEVKAGFWGLIGGFVAFAAAQLPSLLP